MNQADNYNHETEQKWQLSRKAFVRTLLLSGIAFQLPWLTSCETDDKLSKNVSPLNEKQFRIIREVQLTLFPEDGNGPSALHVNADKYLLWVLRDPLLDPEENNFIIEGIDKFNNASRESYFADFNKLFEGDKNEFMKFIVKEDWAERWLSRLLTLIFEALLLDPIYGGNPDDIGWHWLNHVPGHPQCKPHLQYPSILRLNSTIY